MPVIYLRTNILLEISYPAMFFISIICRTNVTLCTYSHLLNIKNTFRVNVVDNLCNILNRSTMPAKDTKMMSSHLFLMQKGSGHMMKPISKINILNK